MNSPASGQVFGYWTVKSDGPRNSLGKKTLIVICVCHNERTVAAHFVTSGKSKSCGCMKAQMLSEARSRHDQTSRAFPDRTKEWRAWSGIVGRCENQNNESFKRYGGRGISICPAWRASFEAFMEYIGPAPSPSHSVERDDVNGNYEPGNVRWATPLEQGANKRNNRLITAFGTTLHLAEWARRTGMDRRVITARIKRGWTPEEALAKKESGQ